ncbi:MAG TPA: glycosyltransferase [Conexibacter sp.]|nr:glycosyltransferase [Conexibacter sp.]
MNEPLPGGRRILLVAYYYPPLNSIGARRPYALAKWLRRRGHDVTVLTSVLSGEAEDDAATRVVRARDLLATRLNWRSASRATATGGNEGDWNPDPGIWGSIFVPDVQLVSWMPFAVGIALRLHRQTPFDAVITTSPTEVVHAVGFALQRRGVTWVADLRDGWRFEAPRPDWPLAPQRRFDDMLERQTVRRADAVVTVSDPLAEDLRRRHDVVVETITNGFDPEAAIADEPPAAAIDPAKLTLVHTGGLGGERTLQPLLDAHARLVHEDRALSGRVELVLAGQQTASERAMYARHPELVRHLGFVTRPESLALQRAADVLVLVTSGARTGEATGKLFEYLATGRPIVVLGAGSAAGDIVARTQTGIAIPTHDADAAMTALRKILAGELPAPAPAAREPYAYPAIAERYEQLIERTIGGR